jgi:hypothetical protein
MEESVVPSYLIDLGQQVLSDARISVANGEPVIRTQLLVSEFYEALKRELRAPHLNAVERSAVIAAANQCCHAATASITPAMMLGMLRTALAMLQQSGGSALPERTPSLLRVTEGGLLRV